MKYLSHLSVSRHLKTTVTTITTQERHDKIETHYHNEYPLLYMEAEILALSVTLVIT